jgi:TRAP-type C4-dicarboxylate transport system substrate-binding protein
MDRVTNAVSIGGEDLAPQIINNWLWYVNCMRKISRRDYIKIGGTGLLVGSAGCQSLTGSDSAQELILATAVSGDFAYNVYAREFKRLLEAESDGAFKIDLQTGGVYGSEPAQTETLQAGEIDMIMQGLGVSPALTASEPVLRTILATWVYEQEGWWDHMLNIIQQLRDQADLFDTFADASMTTLGMPIVGGMRHVTANKAIRTPEDANGVSLRLPTVPGWPAAFSALGFEPESIEFPEWYSSLQSGVVDGGEGESTLVLSENIDEVQSHYNMTYHYPNGGWHHVNTELFESLDTSEQDMMRELAEQTLETVEPTVRENLDDDRQALDMETVDDVDLEAMHEIVRPVIREEFNNNETTLSYDEIRDLAP